MSDFIPNTFQTPNAIVDKLMFLLTDSEFRVLMYMVRHILGWQKKAQSRRACISLSNFVDGFSYDTPDGEMSYAGCGLGKNTVRKSLESLKKYNVVKAIGKPKAIGQEWELAFMTDDNVDIAGLTIRQEKKHRKAKKRTSEARKNNPKNTGVSVQQIQGRGISPTDTKGISPTDTKGISPTDNNETHRKDHRKDQDTLAAVPRVIPQKLNGSHHSDNISIAPPEKQNIIPVNYDVTPEQEPEKPDIKELADVIEKHLNMHNGRQFNIAHMLQGTAKKGEYAKYGQYFVDKPMSADEFDKFYAYFRRECEGCPLAKAETIADWVGKYRAVATIEQDNAMRRHLHQPLPLNLSMLEVREAS